MVQTVSIPVRYQLELFQDARGKKEMSRYIDADKIKQELLEEDAKIGKPKNLEMALKSAGVFHALIHIQFAETEDVAPVVHAHWIKTFYAENGYFMGVCSHCSLPNIVSLYCGKCGAKMDEGSNDG